MKDRVGCSRRQLVTASLAAVGSAALTASPAAAREAYGSLITEELASLDFSPAFTANYGGWGYNGIQLVSGEAVSFIASLRLPVGAKLRKAVIYINPNGAQQRLFFARYNPLALLEDTSPFVTSSFGSAPEEVTVATDTIIEKRWIYRMAVSNMSAGGPILFGGRVEYRLPV